MRNDQIALGLATGQRAFLRRDFAESRAASTASFLNSGSGMIEFAGSQNMTPPRADATSLEETARELCSDEDLPADGPRQAVEKWLRTGYRPLGAPAPPTCRSNSQPRGD